MTRSLACAAIVLFACRTAHAQEALSTLLEREYVAHWLVCGPFVPDVEGGLLAAVAAGRAPLGSEDFMAQRGGATKIRPQHLDIIETEQGDAVWQRAGANNFTLDLSPFYPSAREGITYAGFYARSDAARTVYIDLQTPLGARVWLNGYLLRDVRAAPLAVAGRDQFLAPFREGTNFLMIETPGAAFEELAAALGMTERELSARGLVNRPLLQGRSGFEIALRVRPAQPLGEVAVVPRLTPEGTFSGPASAPRQDFALTVFNNAGAPTLPLSATVRAQDGSLPLFVNIGSVPGKAAQDARVSVPLGKVPEGGGLPLEITVTDGTLTATFNQTITREAMAEPGKVYWVTGPHLSAQEAGWPPEPAWAEAFQRQVLQARNDSAYGFLAGPASTWEAALLARPEAAGTLRALVAPGQCATEAAYAAVNPLWLSPTLLYRNLLLGIEAGDRALGDAAPAALAWGGVALPAQYAQMLAKAGFAGLVADVPARGTPELARWRAPDGSEIWLRRKEPARGPLGLAELRQMAVLQRRELLARGITSDIIVDDAATVPPEPFLAGETQELARSMPSVQIRGGGVADFFEDLKASPGDALDAAAAFAWPLDEAAPAPVRRDDALWLAHFQAQALLGSAQRLAAFAALYGDPYPEAALARAERALLYLAAYAQPGDGLDAFADALSEVRQAAAMVAPVNGRAASFLASQVDTLSASPIETEGIRALVVFNPSSWTRTSLCTAEITVPAQGTVRLVDEEGADVPLLHTGARAIDARTRSFRFRFVAHDVPGIGHRTYYLAPQAKAPQAQQRADLLIENEFFELSVDRGTGDIAHVTDKETEQPLLTGPGNVIALLPEQAARRKVEAGVWTDGAPQRPGGTPEFRTTVLPGLQEITVRQAFAGGTMVRTVRLYAGLRQVELETSLEGGTVDGLLTAAFAVGGAQHTMVGGSPLGASVRTVGETDLEYRTGAAAGLHPALYWTARAPGEAIQVGTEAGIPLVPALIVHGEAVPLREAAHALAAALSRRGVPAKILPASIAPPDFLWSDSLEHEAHAEARVHGARMCYVIGSPEQNSYCSEVVKAQAPENVRWLAERAPQGIAALVNDARDGAALPTLLLIGPTAAQSAAVAQPIAREIDARGTFTLPGSHLLGVNALALPQHGVALLFDGSANVASGPGGAMVLVLAQGAGAKDALPRHAASWRYALAPLDAPWTDGTPARLGEAYNAPLTAAATDLHGGRLPARAEYLSLDRSAAILADLRPARNGDPAEGLHVLAYNPTPLAARGTLRAETALHGANALSLRGLPREALAPQGKELAIDLDGFEIAAWRLLPAVPGGRIDLPAPAAPSIARGAVAAKYWLHRTAPPHAATPAVSVAIDGPLDESVASVRVRAASLDAKNAVEGIVLLTASEGLSLSPSQLYVNLEPGVPVEREVALLWNGPARPGSGIIAELRVGDQTIRDVLSHQPAPLKVEGTRTGAQLRVRVTNPNALAADGFVDCIVPPAFWPELGGAPAVRVLPARQALSVPAYETISVDFAVSDPEATVPVRIKAAANGMVSYADLPDAPAPAPSAGMPAPPPPRTAPPPIEN